MARESVAPERVIRRDARAAAVRRVPTALAVTGVLGAVLTGLIVLPVGTLVLGSFLAEAPRALHITLAGAGLHNYADVLRDPGFGSLLRTTVAGATGGTLGALLLGGGLAWLVVRTDVPGRRWLDAAAVMPMFVSPLLGAFAWAVLASPHAGILNIGARSLGLPAVANAYSLGGIVFVFAMYYAPYAFIFLSASLRNMDPALEEASLVCGAGQVTTVLRVTAPMMLPALLSVALLILVLLLQLFSIPAVLGEPGQVGFVSVRIWELLGFSPPHVNQASALGVMLLAITMALVTLQYRLLGRRSFVTVAGKGFRPRRIALGRLRPFWSALGFVYIAVAVGLPYAALALVALRRNLFFRDLGTMLDARMFSGGAFRDAFRDPVTIHAMLNTLACGLGTVAIGGTLYFAVAYAVHRTRLPGRRVLDYLAMLPVSIPGIIIGLGYLWTWITLPVGLYGTLGIIVLAYISQFAPQGVRAISASLVQIHPELEECSRVCGAGLPVTLRRVVLPLARHGVLAGLVLLFVLSVRELATALFLYTTNSAVLSVVMFDLWVRSSTGLVAALALIQSAALVVLVVAGRRLGGTELPAA